MNHQDLPGMYVGGRYRDGRAAERYEVLDPATGEVISSRTEASVDDVDDAVATAKTAYADWSTTSPGERSAVLTRWAAELTEMSDDIARTETRQTGKPIKLSTEFDVPGSIDNVSFFAGAARNLEGKASGEYSPDHTS
ncbi:MAG: aldehyde dehydrogenase family protein, partial [Rhodococcus sp. (in: high G+C Gram-positive bacteria)]